jgi:outer membrane receptor for ferrienterochelin and colicin
MEVTHIAALLVVIGPVCGLLTAANAADTEPSTEQQEVRIVAKIKPVQTLIDRKVYNVASDVQSVSGTAADVLNTLPSVEVDADGNLSLRGDNRVTILIDGKPSAQLSGAGAGTGLQLLSANDIEKIEVMTTAPAEYRADGTGGVINIITKKTHKLGDTGTLLANVGNQRRYVAGASATHNTEQLKLSGGVGLRQDDRVRIISSSAATTAGDVVAFSNDLTDEHARRLIPSIKGAMDYSVNPDQSMSAGFNFRQRSGRRYADQQNTSSLQTGELSSESYRHSDGHEWSLSGEESLGFKQNLHGSDETVELSAHRSTDRERERYAYLNAFLLPAAAPSQDHLYLGHDFSSNSLNLDYRVALPAEQVLKLGYSLKHDSNGYANAGDNVDPVSSQIVPNPDLTNQFLYRQTVQALYASYEQAVGQWTIVGGGRAERTVSDGIQLSNDLSTRQRYAGWYPNLHLERALDDVSTLSLAYSRRLSRPEPDDLNPYVDHQDIHNLRGGNPNLLPQDTRALEVAYRVETNRQNYSLTGYLRRNRDSLTDITVALSPDVLLSTKTNLPSNTASGMEFSTDGPVTSSLSYRLSGNLFHSQIDASGIGIGGLKSTNGLNLKASLDYRPTQADTGQLSFSRADKRLTPQGYVSPINLMNLGYKRQLRQDMSLIFTVSDAFNGQRFQRNLNTPVLNQTYQREQVGRICYVGLVYAFGASKKVKSAGFEYE